MTSGFSQLSPSIQHHLVNTLGWPSLRPLQQEAIAPVTAGESCLLLAPTAGGKTEAAMLPLLTRMETEAWTGTSVLYLCPLRALLNNLEPRLTAYAQWVGRTVGVRHGDTGAGARKRQLRDPPDVLLTTPESLEAILVSEFVDHRRFFAAVRAVVVDEIHSFAGDDRGWHLLALLERLEALAGRPLQRIGLSATVGSPAALLVWLTGGRGDGRVDGRVGGRVVAPELSAAIATDLTLDYVGTVRNAASVIAALHQGEKRLVFADSRSVVEQLALELRKRDVTTFVSHSSLSRELRRQSEEAFASARDCVIASTSTLELGVDVGDLDRVVQIQAPCTVASMMQRLGRTGRRPGTTPNLLMLTTNDEHLLRAAGVLLLWSEGFVEPIVGPAEPWHIVAQQALGLALQEHRLDIGAWGSVARRAGLVPRDASLAGLLEHLSSTGFLDRDGDVVFVGPRAEQRFGRRHFMELTAAFSAAPEIRIRHQGDDIGGIDPLALTTKRHGPLIITLAGRSWRVRSVDWRRRVAWVEPSSDVGSSRWSGGSTSEHWHLTDAKRRILLAAEPTGVTLSARARDRIARLREDRGHLVSHMGRVIVDEGDGGACRWWTWAGQRANVSLQSGLRAVAPLLSGEAVTNEYVSLPGGTTAAELQRALGLMRRRPEVLTVPPPLDPEAMAGLKFSELLPAQLLAQTVGARMLDPAAARRVLASQPISVCHR